MVFILFVEAMQTKLILIFLDFKFGNSLWRLKFQSFRLKFQPYCLKFQKWAPNFSQKDWILNLEYQISMLPIKFHLKTLKFEMDTPILSIEGWKLNLKH